MRSTPFTKPIAKDRDCPHCKGVGCERCDWSGWIDDRETAAKPGTDPDPDDAHERTVDAGNGVW